jgi:hypothetical protein
MEERSQAKPRIFTSAFICEKILKEEGGLITAIRLVDAFEVKPVDLIREPNTLAPQIEKVYLAFRVGLIVVFVCEQRAEFTASVRIIKPTGQISEASQASIPFVIEDGVNGCTLNVDLNISGDVPGTYWFEIYVDRELATKLPLLVLHQSKESYKQSLYSAKSVLPSMAE